MGVPLDLDSLRRQYPDMPGWGERVFTELHALREAVESKAQWSPRDVIYIATVFAGALAGLKGTGTI